MRNCLAVGIILGFLFGLVLELLPAFGDGFQFFFGEKIVDLEDLL